MKQKMPLKEAEELARYIIARLSPYCDRIEIAGSIRRRKSEVGDIELVVIPAMHGIPDMFGGISEERWELDTLLDIHGKFLKNGHRYKQIALKEGINLDLFSVLPPAQWGVIYLIRTGPADFSRSMVTSRRLGGYLPSFYQVKDGAIWDRNTMLETPEEADFFKLCGMEFIPPEQRV